MFLGIFPLVLLLFFSDVWSSPQPYQQGLARGLCGGVLRTNSGTIWSKTL